MSKAVLLVPIPFKLRGFSFVRNLYSPQVLLLGVEVSLNNELLEEEDSRLRTRSIILTGLVDPVCSIPGFLDLDRACCPCL